MGFVEREGRANTRSIRIDKALDDELDIEANRQGYSISNLMERIVERYLNHYRWSERQNSLTLSRSALMVVLECLHNHDLVAIGERLGVLSRQDFMMKGIPIDANTCRDFVLNTLGDYEKWFIISYHNTEPPYFFIRNDLGEKWTQFLEAYFKSFYKENLGTEIKLERVGQNLQLFLL